jgi:DNA-binding NarL/FixJ family response regulator
MPKKILIVDDHGLFASGLESILAVNPDYMVNSRFRNGKDVLLFLGKGNSADLIILDLNMPVMDGIQCLNYFQRNYPKVRILVVSMHQTETSVCLCKKLGASGYVGKNTSLQVLKDAIEIVLKGGEYFEAFHESDENLEGDGFYSKLMKEYNLSNREIDIIQLIINQFESNEIADKLHLSPLTVKTHRKNIYRKLGVRNLTGLVALMREQPRI